jgi:diguanylate cyclase (GGDEF)-like protein
VQDWIQRARRAKISRYRAEHKEFLTRFDLLTGLFTRKHADRILQKVPTEERRHGDAYGYVLVDLDHFKQVNDVYGHPVGDLVLRQVGHEIREQIRESDVAYRYGGEELGILFCKINPEFLWDKLEQIRKAIEQFTFDDHPGLRVTASFGYVVFDPKLTLKENRRRADKALYASKRDGRNRITEYDPMLDREAA